MACISDDEKLLYSRLKDALYLSDKHGCPCFLGFLDLREQALILKKLSGLCDGNWQMYGGYADAERSMLAVFPDYYSSNDIIYPFTAVAFRYRSTQNLTHRDFLGTILSTGVRRDKVGDILCGEGMTVVFLHEEIAPYICEQVQKVGGEGVTAHQDYTGELPIIRRYMEIHETIASPRLDAVVKALIHVSREESARMIRTGLVSIDHLPTDNVSYILSALCTVSVRGYGRFLIDRFGPETKKGRLQFLARKCI